MGLKMDEIVTFKDLMNEIAWSWEYPAYDFRLDGDTLVLNKLFITKKYAEYKTDRWELAPGVFDKAVEFYRLLNDKVI